MSEAIAFDSHRFVKRLTESGFTERQAETLADEHIALLNANLATEADIAAAVGAWGGDRMTGTDTESPGRASRAAASIRADLQALKADLLKCGFVALIVHGAPIVTFIKLL